MNEKEQLGMEEFHNSTHYQAKDESKKYIDFDDIPDEWHSKQNHILEQLKQK